MEFNLKPRKIMSINYSFFVSLPIDWLNHHKISKGEAIEQALGEGGELILRPKK